MTSHKIPVGGPTYELQALAGLESLSDPVLALMVLKLEGDVSAISSLSLVCRRFYQVVMGNNEVWRKAVRVRWGSCIHLPLHTPSEAKPCNMRMPETCEWWRWCKTLEVELSPHISSMNMDTILSFLRRHDALRSDARSSPTTCGSADGHADRALRVARELDGTLSLMHALCRRTCWDSKRRMALWLCNEGAQDRTVIPSFLLGIDLKGRDVLSSAEASATPLPFLPMDAGQGADRVISAFSQVYVRQQQSKDDLTDDFQDHRVSPLMVSEDAVYVLVYALIMLNTDLQSPAIRQKITREEWVQSVNRTDVRAMLKRSDLEFLYSCIQKHPLRQRTLMIDMNESVTLSGDNRFRSTPVAQGSKSGLAMKVW
eukprot:CAMPEP_0114289036 /NCGR_PEP_ID=MMETSP0059-20121206/7145_1 /TAXON_ID=36894 /ORGANISM="Pyramimonas parkeae, Strain CCMP726" /LENGTH=370 /DNA_ID=CAMNT_0001410253 /DNA_START=244 /DNA_END=1354 /DNA_ORIENTATION=+